MVIRWWIFSATVYFLCLVCLLSLSLSLAPPFSLCHLLKHEGCFLVAHKTWPAFGSCEMKMCLVSKQSPDESVGSIYVHKCINIKHSHTHTRIHIHTNIYIVRNPSDQNTVSSLQENHFLNATRITVESCHQKHTKLGRFINNWGNYRHRYRYTAAAIAIAVYI